MSDTHHEHVRDEAVDEAEFGAAEPIRVRRNVTISVRFSDAEMAAVRERAAAAGMKATSYIRSAVLDAQAPLDRDAARRIATDLEERAQELLRALD